MNCCPTLQRCTMSFIRCGIYCSPRLGDTYDLAAEAQVQDLDSCPAADGALHITKAHTIIWHKIVTKQM